MKHLPLALVLIPSLALAFTPLDVPAQAVDKVACTPAQPPAGQVCVHGTYRALCGRPGDPALGANCGGGVCTDLGDGNKACLPNVQTFTLESLSVVPDLQANITDPSQVLVPSFHGTGEFNIVARNDHRASLVVSEDFHVAPQATVGTSDDVARRLRFQPGVVGGQVSVKASLAPALLNQSGQGGTIGFTFSGGFRGEYESTNVADQPASGPLTLAANSFFLGSSDATVGLWLRFLYVGVEWSHFWVAGPAPQTLAADVQNSNAFKGQLALRVKASAQDGGTGKAPADNYFIVTVGADRPWSPPVVQLQYAISFSPL